jgi:hypothetical protein
VIYRSLAKYPTVTSCECKGDLQQIGAVMLWNSAICRHRCPSRRVVLTINKIVCNLPIIPLSAVLLYTVPAHAGPCSDEIARLATVLAQAKANGQAALSAPETVGAQLHRQPTPESVENATAGAEEKVELALAAARKLDSEGKDAACMATLADAAVPLGAH